MTNLEKTRESIYATRDLILNLNPKNNCQKVCKQTMFDIANVLVRAIGDYGEENENRVL